MKARFRGALINERITAITETPSATKISLSPQLIVIRPSPTCQFHRPSLVPSAAMMNQKTVKIDKASDALATVPRHPASCVCSIVSIVFPALSG